jgi:hypothetical protein
MNGNMKSPAAGCGKVLGRPKKLHFSPAASRRLGGGIDIGSKVIIRWSDGLLYSGKVLRVGVFKYIQNLPWLSTLCNAAIEAGLFLCVLFFLLCTVRILYGETYKFTASSF